MSPKEAYELYKGLEFDHEGSRVLVCGYASAIVDNRSLLAAVLSGSMGPAYYSDASVTNGCVTHNHNDLGYHWVSVDEVIEYVHNYITTTTASNSPLSTQVGGEHYKKYAIQPAEFIHANSIPWLEGSVIKYVVRHKDKGKAEDIKKAIHLLEMLLEMEYKTNN